MLQQVQCVQTWSEDAWRRAAHMAEDALVHSRHGVRIRRAAAHAAVACGTHAPALVLTATAAWPQSSSAARVHDDCRHSVALHHPLGTVCMRLQVAWLPNKSTRMLLCLLTLRLTHVCAKRSKHVSRDCGLTSCARPVYSIHLLDAGVHVQYRVYEHIHGAGAVCGGQQ